MIQYTIKVYYDRTEWFKEGKRHREDGPALEWADGHKIWYKEGKVHREDGPALEWADDTKSWYLNGVEVTENQVMKPNKRIDHDSIRKIIGT